jgi:hypothetical protein
MLGTRDRDRGWQNKHFVINKLAPENLSQAVPRWIGTTPDPANCFTANVLHVVIGWRVMGSCRNVPANASKQRLSVIHPINCYSRASARRILRSRQLRGSLRHRDLEMRDS